MIGGTSCRGPGKGELNPGRGKLAVGGTLGKEVREPGELYSPSDPSFHRIQLTNYSQVRLGPRYVLVLSLFPMLTLLTGLCALLPPTHPSLTELRTPFHPECALLSYHTHKLSSLHTPRGSFSPLPMLPPKKRKGGSASADLQSIHSTFHSPVQYLPCPDSTVHS
jgi:hypothetical protein